MDNMNILNKRYSENVTGNNKSHYSNFNFKNKYNDNNY